MKKMMFLVLMGLLLCSVVFAAENYTVQSVSGRVEREVSPSKWVLVKQGEVLTEHTVIRTGINASLTLVVDGKVILISALQNGQVASLAGNEASSGIKLSGKVAETDTSALERASGKLSTASARASDEAEETWAEEE